MVLEPDESYYIYSERIWPSGTSQLHMPENVPSTFQRRL